MWWELVAAVSWPDYVGVACVGAPFLLMVVGILVLGQPEPAKERR